MVPDDETILEFLAEHQIPTTAQIMAFELDVKHGQLKNRLRTLREHGMVKHPDDIPEGLSARGVYEISALGRRFLEGDITLNELRELDPAERDTDG